jgi:hypothetical protein
MQVDHSENLKLTSQATTIDPSVLQSRILQSASIQRDDEMLVDDTNDAMQQQPHFPAMSAVQASGGKVEYRRVRCPPHRYTPLREHWEQILTPLVEYLKLQVSRQYSFFDHLNGRLPLIFYPIVFRAKDEIDPTY